MLKRTSASRSTLAAKGKAPNKKLFAYGVFVCIAIILWYVINLGKTYSTDILIPVEYIDAPQGMLISDNPGNQLRVGVRASGFSLLKSYVYSRLDPVVISLSQYPLIQLTGKGSRYFIPSHLVVPYVNNALGRDLTVNRIYPDSLMFRFSPKKTIKVPVIPVLNLTFEKQYMSTGTPILHPDSVYIAGPSAIVDTIQCVYTNPFSDDEVSDTLKTILTLSTHPRLLYSFTETDMVLPVERYTEATVSVPISVINIPDSLRIHIFPTQVNVQCKVGISYFEKLSPSLFDAHIDFASLGNNKGKNLSARVVLSKSPEWISGVTITPSSVEYLIERQ